MDLPTLILAVNAANGLVVGVLTFELVKLRKRVRAPDGKFDSAPTLTSICLGVASIVLTLTASALEHVKNERDSVEAQAWADEQRALQSEMLNLQRASDDKQARLASAQHQAIELQQRSDEHQKRAEEWQAYEAGLAEREATASIALDGIRAYFNGIQRIIGHTSSATSTIGAMIACTSQNRGDDGRGIDSRYREFLITLIDGIIPEGKKEREGGHCYAVKGIREQQFKEAAKLDDILGGHSPIAPTVLNSVGVWMDDIERVRADLAGDISGVRALAVYQELKAQLELVRNAALADEVLATKRVRESLLAYRVNRPTSKPK